MQRAAQPAMWLEQQLDQEHHYVIQTSWCYAASALISYSQQQHGVLCSNDCQSTCAVFKTEFMLLGMQTCMRSACAGLLCTSFIPVAGNQLSLGCSCRPCSPFMAYGSRWIRNCRRWDCSADQPNHDECTCNVKGQPGQANQQHVTTFCCKLRIAAFACN